MNYKLTLAQPVYYYEDTGEIRSNLAKELVCIDEIAVFVDEIVQIKEIEGKEPFQVLIKAVEKEVSDFSVYGYYLVGRFDLKALKEAIDKGLVMKRHCHIAFSDKPLSDAMEKVAISYNDTHVLVESHRKVKLVPRKG